MLTVLFTYESNFLILPAFYLSYFSCIFIPFASLNIEKVQCTLFLLSLDHISTFLLSFCAAGCCVEFLNKWMNELQNSDTISVMLKSIDSYTVSGSSLWFSDSISWWRNSAHLRIRNSADADAEGQRDTLQSRNIAVEKARTRGHYNCCY